MKKKNRDEAMKTNLDKKKRVATSYDKIVKNEKIS